MAKTVLGRWEIIVAAVVVMVLQMRPVGLTALQLPIEVLTQEQTTTTTTQGTAIAYSGQGAAVLATRHGSKKALADTGTLTETGDGREASNVAGSIRNTVSGEALHAAAVGGADRTLSEASAANLVVSVAGSTITAEFLMGRAAAVCGAGGVSLTGASEVEGLTLNGAPVTVTGAPNQTFIFTGGQGVINEQVTSGSTITVNALHITEYGVGDVWVSSASAGITCGS